MFRRSFIVLMALAIILIPTVAEAGFKLKMPKMPWRSKAKTEATKPVKVQKKDLARVERDVQRLESLLAGVKTSAKISDKSWKAVANEADMLASRIYTNVKSATAEKGAVRTAEQLRTHVQNMKKEAYKGDVRKTRRHAARALGAATRLDEWAG